MQKMECGPESREATTDDRHIAIEIAGEGR